MSSNLNPRPENIFDLNGIPNVGTYYGSYNQVQILRPKGISCSGLKQAIGHKRWHFVGLATEEVFISCVLVDVAYAGSAFLCVVDLKNGNVIKDVSFIGMPKLNLLVNDRAGEGAIASFKQPGSKIEIKRAIGSSSYTLDIKLKNFEISANLETSGAPESLVGIGKQNEGKFAVTQKTNLMPTKGQMKLGNTQWSLDGGLGSLDYSSGIYPRIVQWDWGFAQGRIQDGTAIGFNLAKGNNLGGQLDNVLWINGQLYPLKSADFVFEKNNLMQPWKVRTEDGLIDLTFSPKGAHKESMNLVIIKSQLSQIFGLYDGIIRDPISHKELTISNLPGICENQYAKW